MIDYQVPIVEKDKQKAVYCWDKAYVKEVDRAMYNLLSVMYYLNLISDRGLRNATTCETELLNIYE